MESNIVHESHIHIPESILIIEYIHGYLGKYIVCYFMHSLNQSTIHFLTNLFNAFLSSAPGRPTCPRLNEIQNGIFR